MFQFPSLLARKERLSFSSKSTVRIYAAASSILIIIGSLFLYSSLSSPTSGEGSESVFLPVGSTQWTGYVTMSNLLLRQRTVTSVGGSWTIPAINTSLDNSYSAAWVGIGGYGESSLIQTGTLHGMRDGQPIYYAWYELLPSTAVRIQSLHVEPGDKMTASLTLVQGNENLWLIEIRDLTKGESYNRTFRYSSSRLSAEWIVERPSIGGKITTLADFESVTFTECSATIDSTTGTINKFPGYKLLMYSDEAQLVSVSSLSAGGSSFTVDYLGTTGSQPHTTSTS